MINKCFGGFGLSQEAFKYVNVDEEFEYDRYVKRDNKRLVDFIEMNSPEVASGRYSELKVVEIPDDVDWVIEEYDGIEWVSEVHRIWE